MNPKTKNMASTRDFEEIYEAYYPLVNAYFVKHFDPSESEDLAQQTFMRLWAWLPHGQTVKNEKSLIFSIAKSVLCDRLRQKTALDGYVSVYELFDIPDTADFASEIELKVTLRTLSEADRMLIDLKNRGLKSREIGDILGISASAVRTRFQALRKSVEKLLKDS